MLSDKQKLAISHGRTDKFFTLSVGAIRSGKTHSSIIAFVLYTQALTDSFIHLMTGRKLSMIETEILPAVANLAKALGVSYRYVSTSGKVYCGKQIYNVIAGNDVKSQDRMLGITFHSALMDEVTLVPEDFFKTAISRLTFADSKIWAMCNPSYPGHFIKKNYIDKDKVDLLINFSFDDNPSLSDEVKARNEALFDGVFRDRYVYGLWTSSEGLVYRKFTIRTLDLSLYRELRTIVGVDYGISSTTAWVPIMVLQNKETKKIVHYVPEDFCIPGGDHTDLDLLDTTNEIWGKIRFRTLLVDPSAASFKNLLFKSNRTYGITNANNDVNSGIRATGAWLAAEDLIIGEACTGLREELESYRWSDTIDDKVRKEHDHHVDALRYAVMKLYKASTDTLTLPEGI